MLKGQIVWNRKQNSIWFECPFRLEWHRYHVSMSEPTCSEGRNPFISFLVFAFSSMLLQMYANCDPNDCPRSQNELLRKTNWDVTSNISAASPFLQFPSHKEKPDSSCEEFSTYNRENDHHAVLDDLRGTSQNSDMDNLSKHPNILYLLARCG